MWLRIGIVVLGLVAAAIIAMALATGQIGGVVKLLTNISGLVLVAAAALAFLFLWMLLFDVLPKRLRRWRAGPHWRTPRPVQSIGDTVERADFEALKARLEEIGSDPSKRQIEYRDRETGQLWLGIAIEQGQGFGEILTPVSGKDRRV